MSRGAPGSTPQSVLQCRPMEMVVGKNYAGVLELWWPQDDTVTVVGAGYKQFIV